MLDLFGGKGVILPYALDYFLIILAGIPFLGCWMCLNHILRSEGFTRQAMAGMCFSAGINVILDAWFIAGLGMGLKGAAIATVISQVLGLLYSIIFYMQGKSRLRFQAQAFFWDRKIINEILALGASTLGRQGAGSVTVILLNQSLYLYGGAASVAVYGILNRLMSLLFVPIIGMTQGFLPITGYNYGARQFDRVLETIIKTAVYGSLISSTLAFLLWLTPEFMIRLFTDDQTILAIGRDAIKIITLAMPIIAIQSIGAAYYQAIGKPVTAFILTVSRQILLLIPLLCILPTLYGIQGIWLSFPVSDVLATGITAAAFIREIPRLKALVKNQAKASEAISHHP